MKSLNPCCGGRWSQSGVKKEVKELDYSVVLILVVVEDGLRVDIFSDPSTGYPIVLILVVVEDGLREQKMQCDDH